MKWIILASLAVLTTLGARAACLSTCAAISAHTVTLANGNHDFDTTTSVDVCNASSVEISESDSATFNFVIEGDLWHADVIFSNSRVRFVAASNTSSDAKVKISIEQEGIVHPCASAGNHTVDNETSVMWDIPAFIEGEFYTTPDLSPLLNSLSVCPTWVVFEFTSFFGNTTAEGSRTVKSFENDANSTKLTLNAVCPAVTTTTGEATTDEETTGLSEDAIAGIIGGSITALCIVVCIVAGVLLRRRR